jgi:hypothetical protein
MARSAWVRAPSASACRARNGPRWSACTPSGRSDSAREEVPALYVQRRGESRKFRSTEASSGSGMWQRHVSAPMQGRPRPRFARLIAATCDTTTVLSQSAVGLGSEGAAQDQPPVTPCLAAVGMVIIAPVLRDRWEAGLMPITNRALTTAGLGREAGRTY